MNKVTLVLCLSALLLNACRNVRIKENEELGAIFDKYDVEGCFEYYDNNKETAHYYNKERAATPYSPASTFKIFNSLVALDASVVPDEQFIIPWDGKFRSIKNGKRQIDGDTSGALIVDWNRDMSMREAFKTSNPIYYQELARKIGAERMQAALDSVRYGNARIGAEIDNFWLNDTLKISADEQVGFIKRLYHSELPFDDRSERIVRSMMLQKKAENYALYYKTGWGSSDGKPVLWVVGYVETYVESKHVKTKQIEFIPHPYFFAMNFSPKSESQQDLVSLRNALLKDLLSAVHLWQD